MACSTKLSINILSLLLFFMVLLNIAQVTVLAGRPTPTTTPGEKQTAQGTPQKNGSQTHSNNEQTETNPSSKGNHAAGSNLDEKQTDCLDEGTVLIPGVGRYMVGSHPQLPTVGHTFLGDSVPAATNGQYIPGNDDTFVPNPGYEVPNPFHGSVP